MTSTGLKTTIHPVNDLDAAKKVYGALFGEPYVDQPYYVAYSAGGEDVGLDPNGHAQGMTAPVSFWFVPDIEAALTALEAAGATRHQDPRDVGGGNLTAIVKDLDGNLVGLMQEAAQA